MLPPLLDQDLRRAEVVEDFPIQHLVAESGVEALTIAIFRRGFLAEIRAVWDIPLSPSCSSYALNIRNAECVEAVHKCDTDLDFGGLTIGIA